MSCEEKSMTNLPLPPTTPTPLYTQTDRSTFWPGVWLVGSILMAELLSRLAQKIIYAKLDGNLAKSSLLVFIYFGHVLLASYFIQVFLILFSNLKKIYQNSYSNITMNFCYGKIRGSFAIFHRFHVIIPRFFCQNLYIFFLLISQNLHFKDKPCGQNENLTRLLGTDGKEHVKKSEKGGKCSHETPEKKNE